jgi:hypothetical protein
MASLSAMTPSKSKISAGIISIPVAVSDDAFRYQANSRHQKQPNNFC